MSSNRACFLFLLLVPHYFSCSSDTFGRKMSDVDFADYVAVEVPDYTKPRRWMAQATIRRDNKEHSAKFVAAHAHRFEYILFNHVDSMPWKMHEIKIAQMDSMAAGKHLALFLNSNKKFRNYFAILANAQPNAADTVSFSAKEMMKIAARFFKADRVQRRDTSIGGHVCLGINGQKELKSARDYALLEAFCFEAVFRDERSFNTFGKHLKNIGRQEKERFTDFDTLLVKVREKIYALMEEDEHLRSFLLGYYEKNRKNIGFRIE